MLQQLMLMLFVPLVLGPIQLHTEAPKKVTSPSFSALCYTQYSQVVFECARAEREIEFVLVCMKS